MLLSSLLLPLPLRKVKKRILIARITEYKLLLKLLIVSLESYCRRDFEKLDAAVGDNACQLRALMIILMDINRDDIVHRLISLLLECKKSLLSLDRIEIENFDTFPTFETLLLSSNIEVTLFDEALVILLCYVLCETKTYTIDSGDSKIHEKCNHRSLQKYEAVSIGFCDKLVTKFRQLLSECSVKSIQKVALTLNQPSMNQMVSDLFVVSHLNVVCLPIFWTFQVMFMSLIQQKIPIILHVKFMEDSTTTVIMEDFLKMKQTDDKTIEVDNLTLDDINSNTTCLVVQGLSNLKDSHLSVKEQWKLSLQKYGLDVLFAYAAHHRQYPNVNDESVLDNIDDNMKTEWSRYKQLAEDVGFCLTNPKTFFTQHVYATTLNRLENVDLY